MLVSHSFYTPQVCRQCHGAGFTDGAEMALSVQLVAGHRPGRLFPG